jgi:regulator of protease activity HflC (stomatin/prohibitin superfamily)
MEVIGGLIVLTMLTLLSGVRIVKEYDRLVIMRFGRLADTRGPGLRLVIPFCERAQKVDTRVVAMAVPDQDAITRDNVAIKISAACFFQVEDPAKAVTNVEDPIEATGQLAQAALRLVIGQHELDDILSARDAVNARMRTIVSEQTEAWGIKILSMEIKDISVPATMRRALAREAEAERLRRARVTKAEGEAQAAASLVQAADTIFAQPGAFELRRQQAIVTLSARKNTKLMIPTPFSLTGTEMIMDDEIDSSSET